MGYPCDLYMYISYVHLNGFLLSGVFSQAVFQVAQQVTTGKFLENNYFSNLLKVNRVGKIQWNSHCISATKPGSLSILAISQQGCQIGKYNSYLLLSWNGAPASHVSLTQLTKLHTNWNVCLQIQKCSRQLLSMYSNQNCGPCDFLSMGYFSL